MMTTITVLIVDDHAVVRQGLRAFFALQDDIRIVGEANNGQDAVRLAGELQPAVVLLDLVMPGMDGIATLTQIRECSPASRVLILTSFGEDDRAFPAIQAGAAGYLLKDIEPDALTQAIRNVHQGQSQLHPHIVNKLIEQLSRPSAACETLTEREMDVMRLIARGMSNREIANALDISHKTVKTHVSNILSKLNLADRTQAAIYAIKNDLL